MTDLLICPNDEELRRLALAESDAAEIASFAEHLEHCPLCSERLENLPAFLALLPEIRRGAQSEPEYSLQEVEELRRTFGDRSTVVGGRAQKSALAGTSPSTDISLAGFLAPPEKPDELGRLGHYRVLRVLGAGGMGIVCEAEDLHLERRVALKVMKPALASDPSARRRFQREAKAAAAVEHDHIVPIFHVGEDREIPFLAMPLLKGESLEDRLKREKRLSVSEVCRVGQEIAEGLAVAHERGLIHRDIKPGNIWIESLLFTEGKGNGRVRILDFGLARICGDETPLTYTGAVIGSPGYMAPEQADGRPVDARTDLFSLGCLLYRAATGRPAFQGRDVVSALYAAVTKDPQPPSQLNPELNPAVSDLIMQLLNKESSGRPSSAREVVERIRTIEKALRPEPASHDHVELQKRPSANRRGGSPRGFSR